MRDRPSLLCDLPFCLLWAVLNYLHLVLLTLAHSLTSTQHVQRKWDLRITRGIMKNRALVVGMLILGKLIFGIVVDTYLLP